MDVLFDELSFVNVCMSLSRGKLVCFLFCTVYQTRETNIT